jgi:hypothetical protein
MMKMKRKTRLAMAVGGAIAGAAGSGLVLAQGDSMGQVVSFPYYTVSGGWQSLYNVTNTTSAALAVKVRFHEGYNSRDVLDFNILMSPYDAWTGWIQPNAGGGASLLTSDKSCTSPIISNPATIGLPMAKAAYTGAFSDGGDDTPARLQEGYVELIVMGECQVGEPCMNADADTGTAGAQPGIGYLTAHVDGVPVDCATADSYFVARDSQWDGSSIPTNGNPIAAGSAASPSDPRGYGPVRSPAPLKGNMTMVNIANGVAGGTEALHLAHVVGAEANASVNMVTAQQFPWFLEPTMATVASGNIWDTTGLDGYVEIRINATNVINEWSSNPDLGVATDWIVSFPTKGFHVDQFCSQIQANNNRWRYEGAVAGTAALAAGASQVVGAPLQCASVANGDTTLTSNDYSEALSVGTSTGVRVATYAPTVAPFENRWADGKSDITVTYALFDREEGGVTASGTVPSPAPPGELPAMPYETNILAFTSTEDPNSAASSPNAQPIPASDILSGAPYGWMNLGFGTQSPIRLPVTGFELKTRTFGSPDMHYGQIQKHGYIPAEGTAPVTPGGGG